MSKLDEMLQAAKDYARGIVKGNTADTLGAPVDLTNLAISPITKAFGIYTDEPTGGSKQIRRFLGLGVEDKNLAETAGTTVSVGGAIKVSQAMLIAAFSSAKKADWDKFTELEKLAAAPKEIYRETGIYRGPIDQIPRMYLSDRKAKIKPKVLITTDVPTNKGIVTNVKLPEGYVFRLDEILDHPELFSEAPELSAVLVKPNPVGAKSLGTGQYAPGGNMMVGNAKDENSFLSVLLHETQHAVQELDGFVGGANSRYFSKNQDEFELARATANKNFMRMKEVLNASLPTGVDVARAEREPEKYKDFLNSIGYQKYKNYGRQVYTLEKGANEAFDTYLAAGGEAEARAVQKMYELSNTEGISKILPTTSGIYDLPTSALFDPATTRPFIEDKVPGLQDIIDEVIGAAFSRK